MKSQHPLLKNPGCIGASNPCENHNERSHHRQNENISDGNRNSSSSRLPMMLKTLFPKDLEAEERRWKGPFSFVHAADCQLGLIEKHILKKDNPKWEVDKIHLKCAIQMINKIQPKPRFLVIGGDMVDTPPYEDVLDIHTAQYEDFVRCMEDLDPEIKLIVICGNHDVGDVPTARTMDIYGNEFGPDFFSFWMGGVKFSVLNSQYFRCPEALPMSSFMQNEFLEKDMKDAQAIHSGGCSVRKYLNITWNL
jgi:hypothetical protein